ncbi:MAG: branched-chain amino acid ABC transporter permease [Candidatus Rokuibacteriota bacterium]|nr:MAG: branched-chain amino acid ABC transporter permease [Candidatus Rokubacteria bacterium 13_1_20CM_4_68_9]PYM98708.1 MAG: branched-chain amino acid ABC transporter permease [Candidatus Rokubacteria bacterium]PYN60070.1 MAG: branched-chain amino acid ABC transporter permease [Candidatus Rokubacteria bacterium]
MTPWILQALNGLSMGALLFLLASGFTLTFGLVRLVNLAHGGFYLLGGYLGLSVLRLTGNFWLGLLAGGVGIVIVSWATDRFLIRRTRDNVLGQVLLTVGVAYVIADVCLLTWGGNPLRIPQPEFARGPIDLPGGLVYPRYRFLLIVFGAVIALALGLLYHRTQLGAIIRAGVDDREMVNAVGVNIDRLFALVFGLAAFLAGLSGVAGGAFLTLYPGAEWEILAYALVVVIVGGLGSLGGAMAGSVIVGLVDAYGRWLLPEFSYFMIFGPMAILLLVRPTGLFGREA